MKRFHSAVLAIVLLGVSAANAATYTIDPVHSSVSFSIRHLVGHVIGRFNQFEGTFNYETGKPDSWKTEATIQAASISTENDRRDTHLKSPDFFDVATYPTLSFKSTGVTDVNGDTAKLHGDLTIHGVTKPVVLDLEIGGVMKDPMGKQHAGATATVKINRKDYGLTWNKVLETGGLMVGDDVDITIDIEGVLKQ